MGFFYESNRRESRSKRKLVRPPVESSAHLLNRYGCSMCPLDKQETRLLHPKMDAHGAKQPLIYLLGEAPGETEDEKGQPFVGKSGNLLRAQFPAGWWHEKIRRNNVIRCHPEGNRDPTSQEVECCRGYIEQDIAESKPELIVAIGNEALAWFTGERGIIKWRNRFIPVSIRGHICWMFVTVHPSAVLRADERDTFIGMAFERDIHRCVRAVQKRELGSAENSYHASGFDDGITIIDGSGGDADLDRIESELNELQHEPVIGFDYETRGLRPYHRNAEILTVAMGTFDHTVTFPIGWNGVWNPKQRKRLDSILIAFIQNSGAKVCHHLGFELEWTAVKLSHLLLRRTVWEDTLELAYVIDPRQGLHSLDWQTYLAFGFQLKDQSLVDASRLEEFPLPDVLKYNAMDARWTVRLWFELKSKIADEQWSEYERLYRATSTLVLAQMKGALPSKPVAQELDQQLQKRIETVRARLRATREVRRFSQVARRTFNPDSAKDVVILMRDILKRDEGWVDEVRLGKYSTKEEVLSSMPADEVPSAPLIVELRSLSTIHATFVTPIVTGAIIWDDGKLHTTYKQTWTRTGRLSSEDPNLQNFPKRKWSEVRRVIVASPNHRICSFDFGAIEACVIAMASEDARLVEALWNQYDIHMDWTLRFLDHDPDLVTVWAPVFNMDPYGDFDEELFKRKLRGEIKNKWVFPQFFGSHYKNCARNMQVRERLAEEMANEFWNEFSGVRRWQDRMIRSYQRQGYVTNLLGSRRRYAPLSHNEIINTPIQGTASDIVIDAMNRCSEYADAYDYPPLQPMLNIHDDLTFEIPTESLEADCMKIIDIMLACDFPFINVPLVIEGSVGKNWADQEEFGIFRSNE